MSTAQEPEVVVRTTRRETRTGRHFRVSYQFVDRDAKGELVDERMLHIPSSIRKPVTRVWLSEPLEGEQKRQALLAVSAQLLNGKNLFADAQK